VRLTARLRARLLCVCVCVHVLWIECLPPLFLCWLNASYVSLDDVGCRLDALLTIQADHELLDVFMGAQRQMRHLMDENRALQEETVRLVRRTEVLVGECDDERRNRRKFVSSPANHSVALPYCRNFWSAV